MQKHRVIEEIFQVRNRQMSQASNKGKFWCGCCDADMVGKIGKCGTCGGINEKTHKIKGLI